MMLDHALECPGLRPYLAVEAGVEIKPVFALDMRADEGGIGDPLAIILDVRQLPFWRGRRHGPLLAIGEPCHLELDLGLGHERTDFRQTEACAKAVKGDHASLRISR